MPTRLEAVTAQATTPPPGPRGQFPVNPPEKFDSDPDALPTFLAQCNMYMELLPEDFLNKPGKVYSLFSLLKGVGQPTV